MICLSLDASSKSASCALTEAGKTLYEAYLDNGLTHSSSLLPMVEDALRYAGKEIAQVELIAVTVGPGSFTGVRIGVATAMGLAAGRPVAAVPTLAALAAQAGPFGGLVCPMLDARAGQVYAAAFDGETQVLPDTACPLEALLERLEGMDQPCLFVGDGAAVHAQRLARFPKAQPCPAGLAGVHGWAVAQWALAHPKSWMAASQLRPVYLRAPQAVRERQARLAKEEAAHG